MGNIIRLNGNAPKEKWLSISNQGTDMFLELLLNAAEPLDKTPSQQALIGFLADRKDINDIAPGTAGFDLDEMPWSEDTLKEDADFLFSLTRNAVTDRSLEDMPHGVRTGIVIPWFDSFADMLCDIRDGVTCEDEPLEAGQSCNGQNFYMRVISNQVRFGCGYRTADGNRQYFAFHGYPSRNDDLFTTSEISEAEYYQISRDYPVNIDADREAAQIFRDKYVKGHAVLMEGWNRLPSPEDL